MLLSIHFNHRLMFRLEIIFNSLFLLEFINFYKNNNFKKFNYIITYFLKHYFNN